MSNAARQTHSPRVITTPVDLHTCGAHSSTQLGSARLGSVSTHLERRLQQAVYPGNLLTERTVLLQEHRRRSPRFGEVGADERVRVVQVLDPTRHGGHVRHATVSWRRPGVLSPARRIQLLSCCRTIRCRRCCCRWCCCCCPIRPRTSSCACRRAGTSVVALQNKTTARVVRPRSCKEKSAVPHRLSVMTFDSLVT